MEFDLRTAVLGSDTNRSLQGVLVAGGLSVLVLLVSFLPLVAGAVVEPGLVIAGLGLASWWAYDNSGLAVSMTLIAGPVIARLTYFWWLYLGRAAPVSLLLSFAGHGAWEMWLPVALSLGIFAFATGVLVRQIRRRVAIMSWTQA